MIHDLWLDLVSRRGRVRNKKNQQPLITTEFSPAEWNIANVNKYKQ
jgi:hypothetical protein